MRTVSELCHIPPSNPAEQRHLARYANAHRCCDKLLMGTVLVGFGVRQHARRESISKRARSTTPTSLHFRINDLRAAWNRIAQNLPSRISDSACPVVPIVCKHARRDENTNCVRPSNVARSLTAIWLSRWCDWNAMPDLQLVRAPRHEVRPAEREKNCRAHPCS
jgi:hypothetical protein